MSTNESRSLIHARGRGSAYRYDGGCRCDECRDAKVAKRRRARARARTENRPSYQRELAASRALKASYTGSCERCGGPTKSSGTSRPNSLCAGCNGILSGERQRAKRATGPTQQKVLAFLGTNERGYTEIIRETGIPPNHLPSLLGRLMDYGVVERPRRGVYRRVLA